MGCQGKACMVKPTLVQFQSIWPLCGRQRKMAETLDQKIEGNCISAPLSNSSGRPALRVKGDERETWSMLHLISAENAGSSKQGHTCLMTEVWYYSTYGCNSLCRLLRQYRQRDKRRQLL